MRVTNTPIPIRKLAPFMPAIVFFGFGGLLKLAKGNPVETTTVGLLLLTFVIGVTGIVFWNAWIARR